MEMSDSIGICLVCAGHSQGAECFCSTLNEKPVSTEFVSNLNFFYLNSQGSRKLKKDNVSHKRINVVLKKIYRILIGEKIEKKYTKSIYRQDFIFTLLSQLQYKGKIKEAQELFGSKIKEFQNQISQELVYQPMYLQELKNLINRYIHALTYWIDEKHKESMKIVYGYSDMRQKNKFDQAVNSIRRMRREIGLPFAE